MFSLPDLSSDLLNLISTHLHANDWRSLKRTNSNYLNLIHSCCDCRSKRLDELNIDIAAKN